MTACQVRLRARGENETLFFNEKKPLQALDRHEEWHIEHPKRP
jgi:hypothetical protein